MHRDQSDSNGRLAFKSGFDEMFRNIQAEAREFVSYEKT